MTAKEFLSKAYLLDQQINSKLEQVSSLRELTLKCTSNISDERVSGTKDHTKMENILCKIVDLEWEIDSEIDRLVDIKKEITMAIAAVANPTYRLILELRYIAGKEWVKIADKIGYDLRHVTRLHGKALREFQIPKDVHKCP